MDPNACMICGNKSDSALSWQDYCSKCAKETWGAAVVASFIRQLMNCQDRLKEAEAKLRNIDQRGR